jgi:hypothetical protein
MKMTDREEVVTEVDGLRVRSAIEIVQVAEGCVTFRLEWPVIEFIEEGENE